MIGSSSFGLAKSKINLKMLTIIEPTDIGMNIKKKAAGIIIWNTSFMKELNEPIIAMVVFFKDKGKRELEINLMVPIMMMDPGMIMKITTAGMISLMKDVETLLTILSDAIGINNFGLAKLKMNWRTVEMNLIKIIGPKTTGRTNLMKDATAPWVVTFLWPVIRAFGLRTPEINLKIPTKIDLTVIGMKPKINMTIGMIDFDNDMEIPFAKVEDFLRAENDNSAFGLTKPEINFKIWIIIKPTDIGITIMKITTGTRSVKTTFLRAKKPPTVVKPLSPEINVRAVKTIAIKLNGIEITITTKGIINLKRSLRKVDIPKGTTGSSNLGLRIPEINLMIFTIIIPPINGIEIMKSSTRAIKWKA